MCLTIPGKVVEIKKGSALIQSNGELKWVHLGLIKNVKSNDWLLSTTEYAVKKIDEEEAKEILDLLETHPVDLSRLNPQLKEILEKARKKDLNKKGILFLLSLREKNDLEALFSEADVIRKTYLKDFICLHGLIEFSNYCENNCFYCGLRKDNKKVKRYRMSLEEIVKIAEYAVKKIGYKMLVLQSGLDHGYSDNDLINLMKKIQKKCRVFTCWSIGERSLDLYKRLRKEGATAVLFRFETSNHKLYHQLHSFGVLKSSFKKRINLLKEFKKIGYYIATGPIIGLPGQTLEDLANDILTMKRIGTDMVSMGPFISSQNTPLEKKKNGDPLLSLKMIAVCRLLMKNSRIPVTTALETLDKEARKKGLTCGANSLMFNLTPKKYRSNYKIYDHKFQGRSRNLEKLALYKEESSWEMLEEEFKKYIKP